VFRMCSGGAYLAEIEYVRMKPFLGIKYCVPGTSIIFAGDNAKYFSTAF